MAVYYAGGFILAAVVWVVCAYMAYQTAPKFGRGAGTWGVLGIIFGPIALMILYILPKHEPAAGHGSATAAHATQKDRQAELYEVPKKHH
jgi:hypothetical protein